MGGWGSESYAGARPSADSLLARLLRWPGLPRVRPYGHHTAISTTILQQEPSSDSPPMRSHSSERDANSCSDLRRTCVGHCSIASPIASALSLGDSHWSRSKIPSRVSDCCSTECRIMAATSRQSSGDMAEDSVVRHLALSRGLPGSLNLRRTVSV